jgi:ABC-type multidrug transport system ATPase subunit
VVRNCDLTYNLFGLWIEKANDVRIEGNTITGKRDYELVQRGNGVQLYNTTGARIIGNNISFVRDALYVDVSHHAIFRGNKLHHSRYGTHYMNSYYNLWEDNDTYYNRGGLALMEVRDQVVRNNRAWGNSDHGIMLRTVQDSVVETTWWPATTAAFSSTTSNTPPARQPGGGQRGGRAPVRRVHAQRGRGQRLHRQPRAGALRGRTRRTLGRQERQPLEQLPGLGPRRQRRGRCALRSQRHGGPPDLAPPQHETAAGQPRGAGMRLVGQQFPVLRVPRWWTPSRACNRQPNGIGAMAWQAFPRSLTAQRNAAFAARREQTLRRLHAVDGVDLRIARGEIFGLIGHNGAGKSTLFKMMLGLIPPPAARSGSAVPRCRGRDFRAARRHLGYLPENVVLYDNLSGLETLRFFAKLKGAPLAQCQASWIAWAWPMRASGPVREYSKGMRQRLGFAQALLGNPQVLFLDEPTNGLDPQAIRDFYATLRGLQAEGVTIIITSHILAELQERVDRLAIMAAGKSAGRGQRAGTARADPDAAGV